MKNNKAIDKYNKSIKRYNNIANKMLDKYDHIIPRPIEVDIDELCYSFNGRLAIGLTSAINNLFSRSYEILALQNGGVEQVVFILFVAIPSAIIGFVISWFVRILLSF